MTTLEDEAISQAYEQYDRDGVLPLDTITNLISLGIDPEALVDDWRDPDYPLQQDMFDDE